MTIRKNPHLASFSQKVESTLMVRNNTHIIIRARWWRTIYDRLQENYANVKYYDSIYNEERIKIEDQVIIHTGKDLSDFEMRRTRRTEEVSSDNKRTRLLFRFFTKPNNKICSMFESRTKNHFTKKQSKHQIKLWNDTAIKVYIMGGMLTGHFGQTLSIITNGTSPDEK